MRKQEQQRITALVAANFRTFGGGQDSHFNPLVHALKDHPPSFAAGVDVADVVKFVAAELRKQPTDLTLDRYVSQLPLDHPAQQEYRAMLAALAWPSVSGEGATR